MEKQALYRGLAPYYDLIYAWKDYMGEAERLRRLIARYQRSRGKDLLEVACGTGRHLQYLSRHFICTGIDINPGMLAMAEKRVKKATFRKADMASFTLRKRFDAITCMFSSIGYAKTYPGLEKTLKNFARHLKAGGVVIIEPWFSKGSYTAGVPHMTAYEAKDVKIARVNISEAKGGISIMDMHYLIAEKGNKVRHVVDRHEMGLFSTERTLKLMERAGLDAQFLKADLSWKRGLFVGVKR